MRNTPSEEAAVLVSREEITQPRETKQQDKAEKEVHKLLPRCRHIPRAKAISLYIRVEKNFKSFKQP